MDDVQKTWDDYYQRKKAERLSEASKLWEKIRTAGATDETVFALDFFHFGSSKSAVEALGHQLSAHYQVSVTTREGEIGYWFLEGTSRPYGINFTEQAHLQWVEFMADVARSHSCVFSAWTLEAPSLKLRFNSESAEDAS